MTGQSNGASFVQWCFSLFWVDSILYLYYKLYICIII